MPRFECTVCEQIVAYPDTDLDRRYFESHKWECNICHSVIAKKRYTVNITDGVTLFSPMSSALGDLVFAQVVRDQYLHDNPDEDVIFLDICEPQDAIAKYKPHKFFWANVTNFVEKPSEGVISYFLENEASEYARRGIYPRMWFTPKAVPGLPERYVVFHIRNISKCPWKNAEPMVVWRLMAELESMIAQGTIDGVALVGNDYPMQREMLPEKFVDLRRKLSLEEIAFVCKYSSGFIGKDSGVAHLAAVSGADVMAWGFRDVRWTPKAAPGKVSYLMDRETNPQAVVELLRKGIKNAHIIK